MLNNYVNLVRSIYNGNLIQYLPLDVDHYNSGTSTFLDASGNGLTGVQSGLTIGNTPTLDGRLAPYSEDVDTDYINLYSASFASALNLDEGSLLVHIKPYSTAIWTDGSVHKPLRILRDADNNIQIQKVSNNVMAFTIKRGAATQSYSAESLGAVSGWMILFASWSYANQLVRYYLNNTLIGETTSGIVQATGSGLNPTATTIFAQGTNGSTSWLGSMAHFALWNRPITDTNVITALNRGYKY